MVGRVHTGTDPTVYTEIILAVIDRKVPQIWQILQK